METLAEYLPIRWSLPDDFMSRSHFERVLDNLEFSSSPGFPYMRQASSNRDFLGAQNGVIDEDKKEHVWQLVKMRLQARDSDPIRLFVKPEPLKITKLAQGRYRLISSVSVVDQIIDHMLFDEFNDQVQARCLESPPKVGWSQGGGGWKIMPLTGWVAMDKSMWDWSVQPWLLQMVLDFRRRTLQGDVKNWNELAQWRYKQLFGTPVFVTSGGLLLRQKHPGVMKSGCVNTIIDNSIMQVLLHIRCSSAVGIRPGNIMAMGDDTLQEDFPEREVYREHLAQFCHVKHVIVRTEFAGFRFMRRRVEPLYRNKHAFVLLHVKEKLEVDTLAAYVLLYHRSEKKDFMRTLMERVGHQPPSPWKCDEIWDG